jgi:hypothetical protein|tara:strand:- start:4432 stop:5253 length:822 start_codon:yes stop_codon:yes gene_type:complete
MVSEGLKIEIRPVPNRSGIKGFSENLEYFSQSHTIAPFVNPVSLKYETGLSKKDIDFLKSKDFPYDISDNYVKGVPHPFWESSIVKVELKNSPIFLFPGRSLIDFVRYKYLLASSYIYSSEQEMLSGIKSQATHLIFNEEEETSLKATKLTRRNNLIRKVSELSLTRKRQILLVLENEVTDNKDEDYLTVRFEDVISNKDSSMNLEELLSKSDEDINAAALIKSAIQKNVLRRTSKGIFYFESNLGFSEEDVKEFLTNTDNQEILINIKSKIK